MNLEQRRASHAFQAVSKLAAGTAANEKVKVVAAEAKKMPARIMTSGLGASLAFLAARKEKIGCLLPETLDEWIRETIKIPGQQKTILEGITKANIDELEVNQFIHRATQETLAYLQWFNRFAEAKGLR